MRSPKFGHHTASAVLQGFGLSIGVYFDNGSEFLAGDLAGRGHRKKSNWQKVEMPVQILSLLGIEMINALPRNARAKPIERFFYTFKEHYSKSVESYCGGKEKRYKNMKHIDIWNEAVRSRDIDFRTTDETNLTLLMRRTTKVQKIKQNGVFIEWAGRKIWYKDENTVYHVNEEVYVRFDPANLQEVQVYEKDTDRFLYTYPCAEYLNVPFVGAKKEDIQTLMRNQRQARKSVKKSLDDYKKFDAVSLLKAELLRAEQNSKGYEIAKPDSFTPVIANELEASGMNITKIEFADLKRLNDVRENSKGA